MITELNQLTMTQTQAEVARLLMEASERQSTLDGSGVEAIITRTLGAAFVKVAEPRKPSEVPERLPSGVTT